MRPHANAGLRSRRASGANGKLVLPRGRGGLPDPHGPIGE